MPIGTGIFLASLVMMRPIVRFYLAAPVYYFFSMGYGASLGDHRLLNK